MPRARKRTYRRRRRRRDKAAPEPMKAINRPAKRKQWTEEQITKAMELAQSGVMSRNRAAEACGVPKSTLKDRLSGRVEHGCRPGSKPYLQPDEEGELTTYLLTAASIGLGKARHEVMRIAEGIAVQKGILKGNKISNGWWRRFHERNPELSLRSGDATAGVRIDAVNEENMSLC